MFTKNNLGQVTRRESLHFRVFSFAAIALCSYFVMPVAAADLSIPKIVEELVSSDGDQRVFWGNSSVDVRTPGIQHVVSAGPDVLENITLIMRDETISFDTFVRCYAVWQQVLDESNIDRSIYWQGGCVLVGQRFHLPTHMKESPFRRKVIADVESVFARHYAQLQEQGRKQ